MKCSECSFIFWSCSSMVEQLTFNQLVVGSNPAETTIFK